MFRTVLIAASLLLTDLVPGEAHAAGRRVNVNDMQMYYEVSGSGAPLIVLHGAYMNIPDMGAIIPKLARTHRVYALEFQGHGRHTRTSTGRLPTRTWRTTSRRSWMP